MNLKQKLKPLLPMVVFLILPWTHRLATENFKLALPWVPDPSQWVFGMAIASGIGYMFYLAIKNS